LAAGKLQGIEVVNGRSYYPEAHRWAFEKKLAMIRNSDIHQPLNLDYHVHADDARPLTLVFARERTEAALKEALFARRTAVYAANRLIGEEQYLRHIFERSITMDRDSVTLAGKKAVLVQIANASDIDYELELPGKPQGFVAPKVLTLAARGTVLMELRADSANSAGADAQSLEYRVANLLVGPQEPLSVTLPLKFSGKGAGD
jgi:3',5'-nucleoside bisphosphate phosphatase